MNHPYHISAYVKKEVKITTHLRRPRIQITRRVRALLQLVRAEPVLIVDDRVVRRADLPLQPVVRLQVEVVVEDAGDALVDDGARLGVPVLGCVLRVGGVEPGEGVGLAKR